MTAARSVAARAARRVIQLIDLDKLGQFDPLDHKLRDAIAAFDDNRLVGIQINQANLDFTAIARVDGPGRVDNRQSGTRRQPRPRVDQADRRVRKHDRYAGGNELSTAGRQLQVDGRIQVDASIVGMRADRQRQLGVEALHAHDVSGRRGR